jgi:hypothetical protein
METPKKTCSIADIKLTRSELIDLIVEDTLQDLNAEAETDDARAEELRKRTWPIDEVIKFAPHLRFTVGQSYNDKKGLAEIRLDYNTDDVSADHPAIAEHLAEAKALEARRAKRKAETYRITQNRAKFKLNVMKRLLEETEEGRSVLEQIKNMKITVTRQLSAKK